MLVGVSAINKNLLLATIYNPIYLQVPDDVETIIIGSSDMQFGLNTELIDNTINLAKPAENLFYSYYKLKFILNSNNKIKNVILGFTPGDLSKKREFDLYKTQFLNIYFVLFDRQGDRLTHQRTKGYYYLRAKYRWGLPLELQKEFQIFFKILQKKISAYDYSFCGGFYDRVGSNKINSDIYYANAFLNRKKEMQPRSAVMIEYLKKTVRLCKEKNVSLYLINTPKHSSFIELIPPNYEKLAAEVLNELKALNSEIHYHDYSQSGYGNDCFFDAAHLNSKGNKLFSREINKLF